MAAQIPATEPTSFIAGDTILWTKSLPDYPATDSWTLTYALRLQQGSGKIDVTASASGSDYAVTIAATVTLPMKPGVWVWAGYVTKGSERHQVDSGTLTVLPNLAAIDSQVDLRTPAKVAYDSALVAWQSVKLGQTVSLNGRVYTQQNMKDLIVYVDRCRADYALELQAQQDTSSGQVNPRHIGVRFNRV